MKLFYRELGAGKPLVILHGVFGSSDNLLSIGKILAEKYKVYILDGRNHGQSPHNEEFNYKVMAEDLREFLIEHKIENPVIMGHSMGGKTVMRFASLYAPMAEKFIVMDISPKFYTRHHDEILDGLNSIDLETLQSRQEADQQLSKYVSEMSVRQFLLKNLERTSEGFKWRINLKVITEKIENVGEALGDDVRINKPVLFIRGGNSNYIREKDEKIIKEIFSNAQLKTLEGTGHWLHAEKPKEFCDIVVNFIEAS